MVGRVRRAFGQQPQRLAIERTRTAVDDEAGRGPRVHRHLAPRLRGLVDDGPAVAGGVASPLTTSTSGSTGAGLKKCMPTTRPGCFRPAASAVIDSDDVFDARIASGATTTLSSRNNLRFDVEILDDRLDHQFRADEVAKRVHRRDPRDRGIGVRARELALCRQRHQRLAELRLRLVGGAHPRIEEMDAMARLRGELCNPVPIAPAPMTPTSASRGNASAMRVTRR